MSHHLTPRTIALGLLTYLLFSTMDSLGRLVMQMGYTQQQVLMCIMSIALLPPLALVAYEKDWRNLWPRQPSLMALRVMFSCIELALVFYTFRHLQLAESYALFFTMPIWVALLAALLLHERLQPRQMLAIGLGFMGVIISNLRPEGLSALSSGHLAGLGAALLAAIGFIVMRKVSHSGSGTNVVLAMFMGLASFNAVTLEQLLPLSGHALLLLSGAGLCAGIAHCSYLLAIRTTPAGLVAPFQYSQVLWALLYGTLLFHEPIQWQVLAGLVLIVSAGWLLVKKQKER